jgi:hypothetical protein
VLKLCLETNVSQVEPAWVDLIGEDLKSLSVFLSRFQVKFFSVSLLVLGQSI